MSDYAKRLAEIEATHALIADHGYPLDATKQFADRGWLLAQLRATSEALTALGIPDDGSPPDERVKMLGNERDMARGLNEARALAEIEADDATTGEDRPCFTGSEEATIARPAENGALANGGMVDPPKVALSWRTSKWGVRWRPREDRPHESAGTVDDKGWTAFTDGPRLVPIAVPHGPETGAEGERCVDAALHAIGCVLLEEADESERRIDAFFAKTAPPVVKRPLPRRDE